ncbi:PIN domain nuclease [soil metagenome]
MYLVDTSVWIDYLREEDTEAALFFAVALDRGYPFGITPEIYQEVLQGAATAEDFEQLAEYLGTQRLYGLGNGIESYRQAAGLYFRCRQAGMPVRSTKDCIVVQICLEHGLLLLHNDRDFLNISRVVPELRLA